MKQNLINSYFRKSTKVFNLQINFSGKASGFSFKKSNSNFYKTSPQNYNSQWDCSCNQSSAMIAKLKANKVVNQH